MQTTSAATSPLRVHRTHCGVGLGIPRGRTFTGGNCRCVRLLNFPCLHSGCQPASSLGTDFHYNHIFVIPAMSISSGRTIIKQWFVGVLFSSRLKFKLSRCKILCDCVGSHIAPDGQSAHPFVRYPDGERDSGSTEWLQPELPIGEIEGNSSCNSKSGSVAGQRRARRERFY